MLLLYQDSYYCFGCGSQFTFHYASTLSRRRKKELRKSKYHLHSTMLLLYQGDRRLHGASVLIYIPLCFYFIRSAQPFSLFHLQFTFHYASTLSVPSSMMPVSKSKFTFHYASTLSGGSAGRHCRDDVFTFHYASTLSRPPFPLLLSSIRGYFLSTPFLHSSPLKNLPPPALQNMNFP